MSNQEETLETLEEPKMYKCWICNEAEFNTKQKLGAHQPHCKAKNPQYKERTNRVPMGMPQRRFQVPKEDGEKYHYHIFNDNWRHRPDRIQRALAAGYEMVEHDRSGENTGTNEDGSEIKGVLMRIPKELYDEDQALKNREMDKIDEMIGRGGFRPGENRHGYAPGGGIKTEVKLNG